LAFSDIDFPISQEAQGAEAFLSSVDQSKVDTLISFGFTEEIANYWVAKSWKSCI